MLPPPVQVLLTYQGHTCLNVNERGGSGGERDSEWNWVCACGKQSVKQVHGEGSWNGREQGFWNRQRQACHGR